MPDNRASTPNEKALVKLPDDAALDTKPVLEAIPPVAFTDLFRYSTPFEFIIDALGLVAAAAAGAAQPLLSLLFGRLTQDFVGFGDAASTYYQKVQTGNVTATAAAQQALDIAAAEFRQSAAVNASYLVYMGVGAFVCTYTYMVIWVYTGEVNSKRIREKYLEAILRQDISYFDNVGAGEVATRIQTDTHLVQVGMSEKVALGCYFISAFLTGFVLGYYQNWRLALAMSSILPCIGAAAGIVIRFQTKYMQLSLEHVADSGTLAEEVISTVRTTHALGIQKTFHGLYDIHIMAARALDVKAAVVHGGVFAFIFFVIYASYGLAFQFGTTLINEGHATAGEVVSAFMAIFIGAFSIAQIGPEMEAFTHGRGAAAKLFATIDRIPSIDSSSPAGLKPENIKGEITLEDVKFSYPSRPDVPIIKSLNITFPAGKTAALVGASGSGKSTIIALVERFYDPLCGSVKLDGVDIRDLNIKWLRSQIGLVSQEPTLFATTIKENVAHGLINTPYEHISEEEKFELIQEACIKANVDGFISKLPQGYDTMVGERGFLLSGGQKQRVAIARAIVSDPRILLLDEATSALDSRSEGIVQDALDKASAGRTTITIAHRLSTIKDADCIYVMGDGLVLEQGTHAELLAFESGAYSRLVHTQELRQRNDNEYSDRSGGPRIYVDEEKVVEEEVRLGDKSSSPLIAPDLVQKKTQEIKSNEVNEGDYSMFYLFVRIAALNRDGLWRYVLGTIFAIMTGMVYPALSIVYGQAIGGFSATDPSVRQTDGNRNALWFFIIAILASISTGFQNYYFMASAAILTSKLRSLGFKSLLRQDIEFFDKDENSTGAVTANLSDNPQKIHGLAGVTLGTIIQSISTLTGASVIGLVYAYKAALVAIACIPFIMSTGYIRLHVVVLKDQQNQSAHENSAQLACEAVASIRTVASLTREEDCLDLYSTSLEVPLRNSNKAALWGNLLYAFSQSISFYVVALVFWYGSTLVANLDVSISAFYVTLMSTTFATIQAGGVFSYVPDISAARGAATAIIKLIDATPDIDAESTEGRTLSGKSVLGQIRLENVHFQYSTRPGVRVLRDLSIKVEPGTYVALVGASGCGKSTIIQLIERFYDPLAGQVLLDGQPINEFNVQEYRKHISLVSQEPTLYAGTIRFNILLGANKPESEVTQEEIEAVCRNANILDFIQSLPNGFDTEVGGKGSQLSGGQKQRIAIARALLRNPKVLLLDEATSALDSNSEKVVQEALDQAAKGRTTIAIAHRLSTIQNADCIYFLKEGHVSEAGTHDELLSLRGDYYEYVQLQVLNK
ncbi:P-loop containing nucleoside triphosphate hydrolase protein [Melanogaster broomeanus]|nr:P-loop containing nucleoside triphosphate hydrolase protein [Melanogaster broomeanus]